MTDDLRSRLVASATRALCAAAFDCPGDCGMAEADCDAQHPIQVAVLHFDEVASVYGTVEGIAAAVIDGMLAEGSLGLAAPRTHQYPVGGLKSDGSTHVYLSTGCRHGDMILPDGRTGHEYCQGETGAVGAKNPAQCKFCAAACTCICHGG